MCQLSCHVCKEVRFLDVMVAIASVPQKVRLEVELEDIAFDIDVDILGLRIHSSRNVRKVKFMADACTMQTDYVLSICSFRHCATLM